MPGVVTEAGLCLPTILPFWSVKSPIWRVW